MNEQTEWGCGNVLSGGVQRGSNELYEIIAVVDVRTDCFYQILHRVGDIV